VRFDEAFCLIAGTYRKAVGCLLAHLDLGQLKVSKIIAHLLSPFSSFGDYVTKAA